NEKITCIAESISEDATNVIDAKGQYVMPGMVDTHVHISEPGRTECEGFVTATKALAAGGTTSYVEMPLNGLPATTNRNALNLKLDAVVAKSDLDYSIYGGLVAGNVDQVAAQIGAGVKTFK